MIESIIFASGCFWCTEAIFQMLRGVKSVASGFSGGTVANPSYYQVAGRNTGHAESIKLEYDPAVVKLEDLLAVFFSSHDPTTLNRQGADIGPEYRSAIYFYTPEQKVIIENYIKKLATDRVFTKPVVTEVKPFINFFPAEPEHQNYYNKNLTAMYCQINIDPKIAKLKKSYARLLK
ncbi:MAG: peptide-methionine (S)-S-oxide reductase MsrA [Candidatus Magasanikbacteria bacterium]|nr:peptide-methionine (S)-S-oxide reductase MsrA [Candidatus Magasanikbacteria bacterium]